MKIKAVKSFTGKVTMMQDEIRDVREEIALDLINSGYAVEIVNDGAAVIDETAETVDSADRKGKAGTAAKGK
ncbi:MAG: hypothetical protein FWG88_05070 [Oscillospiraceae bacterium]|nr:hypothetical protein [Oscillospiraceae bacterium]